MPKRKFPFKPGGPERVTLAWKGMFKNIEVSFDGEALGTIASQKELKEGQSFQTPEGELVVTLNKKGLCVHHAGVPIPGSADDPATEIHSLAVLIYFIGGINCVLAILAALNVWQFAELVYWPFSLAYGAIFIGLGTGVKQKKSLAALLAAMALLAADSVLMMVTMFEQGDGNQGAGGLAMRIIFLWFMYKGIEVLRAWKEPTETQGS